MIPQLETVLPLGLFMLVLLCCVIVARLIVGARVGSVQDFCIGGKSLGGVTAAFTITATLFSGILFTQEMAGAYRHGLGWIFFSFIQTTVVLFVVGALGKRLVLFSQRTSSVTIVDILDYRLGSTFVTVCSALVMLTLTFSFMVLQWTYVTRLLRQLVGLKYVLWLLLICVTVYVYTIIEGFRAVVVTDIVQVCVLIFCGFLLLGFLVGRWGGVEKLVIRLSVENPELLSTASVTDIPVRSISWILSYWCFLGFGAIGLPHLTGKVMAVSSPKSLLTTLVLGTFLVGIVYFVYSLSGLWSRVLIPNPETLTVQDRFLLLEIIRDMPGWFGGIIIVAPFAAVLSTVDSMLLASSAFVVKNCLIDRMRDNSPVKGYQSIVVRGVLSLLFIMVIVLAVTSTSRLSSVIFSCGKHAIPLFGCTFFSPIFLALFWKRQNAYGATASMITGVTVYILIAVQPVLSVSWIYPPCVALVLSTFINIVVSLLTPQTRKSETLAGSNRT